MDTFSIKDMLRPTSETVNVVRNWLHGHGISQDIEVDSDWIYFKTTVSKAERLLKTKYENFRDIESGSISTRSLSYSLPSHIKSHINMIHPTTSFAMARPKKIMISSSAPASAHIDAAAQESCDLSVTPACLARLYGYDNYKPTTIKAKMGVVGFLEQWAQNSDLKSFLTTYNPSISSSTSYKCALVNGGLCSTTQNSNQMEEANLDVQYAVAINGKIPVTFYSVGGRPSFPGGISSEHAPYIDFLNHLLSLPDAQLPTTVSISYGDTENTVPQSYAKTVCNLFSQVGARGVSILVASGDFGSNCDASGSLQPMFPASCPWVTTVGGTYHEAPEQAVFFSSGGFSNYFPQPSYQAPAVKSWLAAKNSPLLSGRYNASGRAFPDVSAQSNNFRVILNGVDQTISGTSASTPAFASMIDLVSNALLAQGKKPLGFLNPFLYAARTAQGLTDITSGTSDGCENIDSGKGFAAIKGWDPATGLGTPKFKGLAAAAGAVV